MPLAHNPNNYLYGKGRVYFKVKDSDGYLDLGNVPELKLNIEVEKTDHFSSRSGIKQKDKSFVTQKMAKCTLTLEEFSIDNIHMAFMGDGIVPGSQQATEFDAKEITIPAKDVFIDTGKTDLFIHKMTVGVVTGGPFQAGETVTGATSGATAKIAWVDTPNNLLELIDVTGTFQAGEDVDGSTSMAAAPMLGIEKVADIVVADAASPTARYKQGEDYDIDAVGGLLRIRLDGAASAAVSVFVSCGVSATNTYSVRALAGSETEGELLFIGDPAQGPRYRVQAWSCLVTISGDVGLISDDVSTIPMELEIQADEVNHPSEPFFRATEIR